MIVHLIFKPEVSGHGSLLCFLQRVFIYCTSRHDISRQNYDATIAIARILVRMFIQILCK